MSRNTNEFSSLDEIIRVLDETTELVDISKIDIQEVIRYDLDRFLKRLVENNGLTERWFIDLCLQNFIKVNSTKVLEQLTSDFFKDYFQKRTYQAYTIDSFKNKTYYLLKRPSFYRIPVEFVLSKLKEMNNNFLERFKNNYESKSFDFYTFYIPNLKEGILFLNYLCFLVGYIQSDVSLIDSFRYEQTLKKNVFTSYGILEKYLQFRKLDLNYFLQELFISGKNLFIVFNNSNQLKYFESLILKGKEGKFENSTNSSFQEKDINDELDKIFFQKG